MNAQTGLANVGPTSNDDEIILSLNELEAVYNQSVSVLHGVDLQASKSQVTSLLGANGAGKSTTLKAISGLLTNEGGHINGGNIHFLGEDITHTPPERIVQMGLIQVMEGRRIIQDMTVVE